MNGEEKVNEREYDTISLDEVIAHHSELLACSIPVFRRKKDGSLAEVPIVNLDLLLGKNRKYVASLTLFTRGDWRDAIRTFRTERFSVPPSEVVRETVPDTAADIELTSRTEQIVKADNDEREDMLAESAERLSEIAAKPAEAVTERDAGEVLTASTDAQLISKTSLIESMSQLGLNDKNDEAVRREMRGIAKLTRSLVNSITQVVGQNEEMRQVFLRFKPYAEGNTIYHTDRVFINFIQFLFYYNECMNKGLVTKLRLRFQNYYQPYYRRLLTNREEVRSLEQVFERGMSRVDGRDFLTLAVGALLHDIGKIENLDYFEGEESRDYARIKRHVYNGYNLIVRTATYPKEVALMAALHHEYSGHSSGYGVLHDAYEVRSEFEDMSQKHQFAVSYHCDSVENFNAIGYFPVKALEVLDVFDALTDPARRYRSRAYSPYEALELIKRDFVEREQKIDPILFDLFVDFLAHSENEDFSEVKVIGSFLRE
ncbi:MAG: HDIG domain-containing metalloprotein [Spirochaetota bacterium]